MVFIGADIGRNTGVACLTCDDLLYIKDVDVYFLNMHNVGGTDIYKKYILGNFIKNIVCEHKPIAFGLEAPFMGRFPKAFGLLSEFMNTIELAVYRESPFTIQYRVSPKEAKWGVGAISDEKEEVYTAMKKIGELSPFIKDSMNEHEIDSIAIAYWVLDRYRKDPGLYMTDGHR